LKTDLRSNHDDAIDDFRKFEDIFDVDHFIDYLKYDVRIVRDIPKWFTDKSELFSSIRFDRFLYFLLIFRKIKSLFFP